MLFRSRRPALGGKGGQEGTKDHRSLRYTCSTISLVRCVAADEPVVVCAMREEGRPRLETRGPRGERRLPLSPGMGVGPHAWRASLSRLLGLVLDSSCSAVN